MDGIICIAGISAIAFRILRDVFHLSLVGFAAVPAPVRARRHNRHRRGVLDGKPETFRTVGGIAAKQSSVNLVVEQTGKRCGDSSSNQMFTTETYIQRPNPES